MKINKTQPGSRKLWEPRFMKWLFAECPKYKSFSQQLPASSQAEPEKCQRLQYFFERSFGTCEIVKWRKRNVANPLYQDHRTDWSFFRIFNPKFAQETGAQASKKLQVPPLEACFVFILGWPFLEHQPMDMQWQMVDVGGSVHPSALRARIGGSPPSWTAWAKNLFTWYSKLFSHHSPPI